VCNISLESSRQGLQLCFRPHFNPRFTRKVTMPQSRRSPNFGETKSHLDVGPVERCILYYKGEGGGFPQVRAVMSLVCPCCPWLVLAPKVLQLCTYHLVLVLWRFVWIDKACQLFLVHPGVPTRPFTLPKCCELRNVRWLLTLPLFFVWDLHLSPSRSWECVMSSN
jgi:hypothetical protein